MIAILSFLLVVTLSLVVTRVASVALVHTGLGREAARFQARSAFSGVGFTTTEAETIVGHPVRRRIVMVLMLLGNIGIVTAMSTLLLSFVDMRETAGWQPFAFLGAGVGLLWLVSTSAWLDRRLSTAIGWALSRFTDLDARDYARLLHVHEEYGVTELAVAPGDWLADKTLGETDLAHEGVLVLGVTCPGGHFIGAPGHATPLRAGDRLTLYGRTSRIEELDCRAAGDREGHVRAVAEHGDITRREHTTAGRSRDVAP